MPNNNNELRDLINRVLNDEEACELLRKLLIPQRPAAPAAQNNWYVWCADLVNRNDGKTYYHPVVTSASMAPSLAEMMDVDSYIMMADQNQFAVRKWEPMLRMTGQHTMLVAIPDETYQALNAALHGLVGKILAEAEKLFEPLDNIAAMTRGNAESMKLMMLMRIFADMRVLFECVDQDMNIHDSEDHNYEPEEDEDEYDQEELYAMECGCGCGCYCHENDEDDYCPCDNCQLDNCDECPNGTLCDED